MCPAPGDVQSAPYHRACPSIRSTDLTESHNLFRLKGEGDIGRGSLLGCLYKRRRC